MKKTFYFFFTLMVAVFFATGNAAFAKNDSEPTLGSAAESGDFELYRKLLDELIDSRLKGDALDAGDKVLLHALALDELVRRTGVENLKTVASTPQGRKFLRLFLADRDWVATYLSSGPVPENTPDGLNTLKDIWVLDKDVAKSAYMPLATAVSLVFHSGVNKSRMENVADDGCPKLTPVARYRFFKDSHKAGRLHSMFGNLSAVELRWVVMAPYGNESLTWLQENVDVPLFEVSGICWIPRYRGVNDFGNTIQGPLFYAPSRPGRTWAEDVALNGGVCGALSTFGALYAQSRGIPATPKGQPGHCAWAYRAAPGEWIACFGGPDGGSLHDFWKDTFAYTWMADDLFTEKDETRDAHQLFWLANRLLEKKGLEAAWPVYRQALARQPLHYGIRKELIEHALADAKKGADTFMTPELWSELIESTLAGMQRHPMPMADLLALFEQDHFVAGKDKSEKLSYFVRIHKAIAEHLRPGWTPWNVPQNVLDRQMKMLGDQKAELDLFRDVLACYVGANHEHMTGEFIEWGGKRFSRTPEEQGGFTTALVGAFSGGEGQGADEKLRRSVFVQAIRSAETSKNIDSFQKLSTAAADLTNFKLNYDYKAPEGGKLVSDKGLLYLGKGDGYDEPLNHRGLLTEQGGFFHGPGKADGKPNFAVVMLPSSVTLTDVVVVNRLGSNQYRNKSVTVYVSTDEQNWTEIGRIENLEKEGRLNLRGKNITARWIKVEKGEPEDEPFHLHNICVYGE